MFDWARNKCPLSALSGVGIKRVEFRENVKASLGAKKTVRNNEVTLLVGVRKTGFDCTFKNHRLQFFGY